MSTLTENKEDYLEAILIIGLERKWVRVRDLAKYLKVKMSSVGVAVKSLAENGLVNHEKYGYIELTEDGLTAAKQIYARHKTLYKFLHHFLGLDEATSSREACRIEHALDAKTTERLLKFLEFIETCPERDPLWLSSFHYFIKHGVRPEQCSKQEEIRKRGDRVNLSKLDSLNVGQKGKVLKITADAPIERRLLEMGVVPGIEIKVEKVAPLGDPVDILVKGYHLTLPKEEASCVTVKVMQ